MKYVKLTAKPDTWFKEGTEVYSYDCNAPEQLCRITLEDWEDWITSPGPHQGVLARGQTEDGWDGEFCMCNEFEVEIVDEPF